MLIRNYLGSQLNRSVFFCLSASFLLLSSLQAGPTPNQPGSAPPKTPPPPSPTIKKPEPSPRTVLPVPPTPERALKNQYFSLPGIIAFRNGQWVGTDNLFNISPNIEVSSEIIHPKGKDVNIDEVLLRKEVEEIFKKAGINTHPEITSENPPLPRFHIIVLINNIESGYVAYYSCQLLEAVQLKRVVLDPGITFQAITWANDDLLIAPHQEFNKLLTENIQKIANEFVGRYRFFENLKKQSISP